MLNIIGTVLIVLGTLLVAANSHGADMGKTMTEWGLLGKAVALFWKYPVLFVTIIGSFLGAGVIAAHEEGRWFKLFLLHASVSVALTPLVIRFFDNEPNLGTWLGVACIMGASSGSIVKMFVDKRIQAALRRAAIHQIDKRIGEEPRASNEQ